ncbi:hypothetical protein HPB47_016767, partial [Ixodes persulcatus]
PQHSCRTVRHSVNYPILLKYVTSQSLIERLFDIVRQMSGRNAHPIPASP